MVTAYQRLCLVTMLLAAAACSAASGDGASSPGPAAEYTGPIADSATLTPDFMWRQEITASRGVVSHSFPAVLQVADDELVVLGLTPMGTRAFVIRQQGTTFEYESFVSRKLPLEPSWILIDIHRTFFDGISPEGPASGPIESTEGGERRTDQWQQGRLMQRTYERIAEPGSLIRIDYGDGYRLGEPPPRIHFENGWYGYRLEVVTTAAQALDKSAP